MAEDKSVSDPPNEAELNIDNTETSHSDSRQSIGDEEYKALLYQRYGSSAGPTSVRSDKESHIYTSNLTPVSADFFTRDHQIPAFLPSSMQRWGLPYAPPPAFHFGAPPPPPPPPPPSPILPFSLIHSITPYSIPVPNVKLGSSLLGLCLMVHSRHIMVESEINPIAVAGLIREIFCSHNRLISDIIIITVNDIGPNKVSAERPNPADRFGRALATSFSEHTGIKVHDIYDVPRSVIGNSHWSDSDDPELFKGDAPIWNHAVDIANRTMSRCPLVWMYRVGDIPHIHPLQSMIPSPDTAKICSHWAQKIIESIFKILSIAPSIKWFTLLYETIYSVHIWLPTIFRTRITRKDDSDDNSEPYIPFLCGSDFFEVGHEGTGTYMDDVSEHNFLQETPISPGATVCRIRSIGACLRSIVNCRQHLIYTPRGKIDEYGYNDDEFTSKSVIRNGKSTMYHVVLDRMKGEYKSISWEVHQQLGTMFDTLDSLVDTVSTQTIPTSPEEIYDNVQTELTVCSQLLIRAFLLKDIRKTFQTSIDIFYDILECMVCLLFFRNPYNPSITTSLALIPRNHDQDDLPLNTTGGDFIQRYIYRRNAISHEIMETKSTSKSQELFVRRLRHFIWKTDLKDVATTLATVKMSTPVRTFYRCMEIWHVALSAILNLYIEHDITPRVLDMMESNISIIRLVSVLKLISPRTLESHLISINLTRKLQQKRNIDQRIDFKSIITYECSSLFCNSHNVNQCVDSRQDTLWAYVKPYMIKEDLLSMILIHRICHPLNLIRFLSAEVNPQIIRFSITREEFARFMELSMWWNLNIKIPPMIQSSPPIHPLYMPPPELPSFVNTASPSVCSPMMMMDMVNGLSNGLSSGLSSGLAGGLSMLRSNSTTSTDTSGKHRHLLAAKTMIDNNETTNIDRVGELLDDNGKKQDSVNQLRQRRSTKSRKHTDISATDDTRRTLSEDSKRQQGEQGEKEEEEEQEEQKEKEDIKLDSRARDAQIRKRRHFWFTDEKQEECDKSVDQSPPIPFVFKVLITVIIILVVLMNRLYRVIPIL